MGRTQTSNQIEIIMKEYLYCPNYPKAVFIKTSYTLEYTFLDSPMIENNVFSIYEDIINAFIKNTNMKSYSLNHIPNPNIIKWELHKKLIQDILRSLI